MATLSPMHRAPKDEAAFDGRWRTPRCPEAGNA